MTGTTAVAVRQESAVDRIKAQLDVRMGRIEELLPPTMDARRFVSVSLMALTKNPGLLECNPSSVVMSILEAAEVGLEPTGGIGGAHLVPFKDKSGQKQAQLVYDYRGLQHLIREGGGGEVKTVLVYEGDAFEVHEGTERPRIVHTRAFLTDDPAKITYVYAVPEDHPTKFEVMSRAQIDSIRARSKSANNGPWVTDYGAMARKSVLKRIAAWLPLKPSARAAIDRDTQREIGTDDTEPTERGSRAAEVRDRLLAQSPRSRRHQAATDAPGAAETASAPDDAAPDVSAEQQPESAGVEAVEGSAREICGERLIPVEGPVENCVLDAGHDGQSHKSESGKRWNA